MPRAVLYTIDACAHCERLRAELTAAGRDFEDVNLTREPRYLTEFLKLSGGRRIVPVLVDGGRVSVAPHGGSEF